ncbi:hypothetical protein BT93_A2303 [Corymbia citriodora subsp. variegata]|nr:hypothetical protein BT93_A2303 [Corymbia citriodora subsp. variegata]
MEVSETSTTPNERLDALKVRYIPAPNNQHQLRDDDLNKIMDLSPSGNSLLHVAAGSGNDDVMELILIQFPNTVIQKNSSEDTALHVAVRDQGFNTIEKLIRWGIESEIIYWKNKDNKSPLYLAIEKCEFLKQRHRKGIDWEILQLLLQEYARDEAYAVKIQGMSPVLAAIEAWDTEIKNKKGQNILHVAAKAGSNFGVYMILKKCGETNTEKMVNSKDVDGNTPLHLASIHNHCLIMRYLTEEKKIDLDLRNNDGLTALDVAMQSRSLSTNYPALLGRAILIAAGIRQSPGRDVLSPREQVPVLNKRKRKKRRSGASESSRAKWIKDQVNTLLLLATLVASIKFTAGSTLPGDYNASGDPHPRTVTMLHNGVFQVFVISNTLAMYSSILAVIVLLWGLSRNIYIAELAYHSAGPLLLMALIGMSVAFFAAVTVAVSKLTWLGRLVLYIRVLYLVMVMVVLAALIFPFSRSAMRIVSLYYLSVAQCVYAVRGSVELFIDVVRTSVESFIGICSAEISRIVH